MLAASFSSFDTMNMAPTQQQQPMDANHVAEKITRRIEIAKVHTIPQYVRLMTDCFRLPETYKTA